MKRTMTMAVAILVAAGLLGCNTLRRQPSMQDAAITPASLKPGESAVITVHVVNDPHKIIRRIVGVVKEDPRVELKLRDDGKDPDAQVDDGIWSRRVDVPFLAAPGKFTLEITAYNGKGDKVKVRSGLKGKGPLVSTCDLEIQYPESK